MRSLLRLIRFPNLLIIALTLYAFRYMVVQPYYTMSGTDFQMNSFTYALMVIITMMIAVAGYLINDYYDIDIDRINRPDRPSVSGEMNARKLYLMALNFTLLSLILIFLLGFLLNSWIPVAVLLIALTTVWWYARYLKKSLLWGNLAVAFMSSLTLGMSWLFEWILLKKNGITLYEIKPITQIAIGIIVFAFLLSLIREIVKDLEDIEGDGRNGCRSIPIVLGSRKTKIILVGLCLLLFALLVFSQSELLKQYLPMVALWLVPAVEIPTMIFAGYLMKAESQQHYRRLSRFIKWIMVGGIASMGVIWLNFKL